MRGSVLLSWFNIFTTFFSLSTVKAHTDLIKRVLSRVIIPGRIMTRVINQCWIFTPDHNSTWNYDLSIIIPPVEYGGLEFSEYNSLINFHDNMGLNWTKIHWILTQVPYSIGIQIYLTSAFKMKVIYNCIIENMIDNLGKNILMICLRFHSKMK